MILEFYFIRMVIWGYIFLILESEELDKKDVREYGEN